MDSAVKMNEMFEKKKTPLRSIMNIQRLLLLDTVDDNKDLPYIRKAMSIATKMYNQDPCNVELLLYAVYLYVRAGKFEDASGYLQGLNQYRKYFKNNFSDVYAAMLYIRALSEFMQKKGFAGKKQLKALSELSIQSENGFVSMLAAHLYMAHAKDYKRAKEHLKLGFQKGCNSPFLYLCTIQYIQKSHPSDPELPYFVYIITPWAITHQIDLEDMIVTHRAGFEESFTGYPWHIFSLERLYEKYPFDYILKYLCLAYIQESSQTEQAYMRYRQARNRQIPLKEIDRYILQIACKKEITDIPLFTIESVLTMELSFELQVYVYHLLLVDGQYKYLLMERQQEIEDFGIQALVQGKKGKYYNTVYMFVYQRIKDDKILSQLQNGLFDYEISGYSDKVRYLWVYEEAKKQMQTYSVKKEKTVIQAATSDFTVYTIGLRQKKIYDEAVTVRKMIENVDNDILLECYHKGYESENLLLALANSCLDKEIITDTEEEIVKKALSIDSISHSFKHQLSVTMGRSYTMQKLYKEAIGYYSIVSSSDLGKKDVENLIKCHTKIGNMDEAMDLVFLKNGVIDESVLYPVILYGVTQERYQQKVAAFSYQLLIKRYYNESFVENVGAFYYGAYEQWVKLQKSLYENNQDTKPIDEKILFQGIATKTLDVWFFSAFESLVERGDNPSLLWEAAYFIAYEIIVNAYVPEVLITPVLEALYRQTKEPVFLLAAGLAKLTTDENNNQDFEEIISYMEKEQILFPVFKDKNMNSPYIKKVIPFIYRHLPEKQVNLVYSINQNEFQKKDMKYFRFGIYSCVLPVFYQDSIHYYFEVDGQNVHESTLINGDVHLIEPEEDYDRINNGLIYYTQNEFDELEALLREKVEREKNAGKLL